MNKIPAKQIYLLTIIIVGIIALSVYSTYALFTFESTTADIVSIHTPKSLQISENIYEYQQITVEPNSVTSTDIDIYNNFEYEVCYSIWYKIVGDEFEDKVQIFQKSSENLTSSGVLQQSKNIRVTIVIINDNDSQVKINLGTIGEQIESGSCSLNLSSDKKVISSTYGNIESLNEKILNEIDNIKNEKTNYLTYKDEKEVITYKSTDKIYISDKFAYSDELFTLEESSNITIQELVEENLLDKQEVYFCKETDKCTILYKLTELKKQPTEETNTEEEQIIYYDITKYDKLIGYLGGDNGLRKINNQDYIFYGDNPNNYIYYNCENVDDTSTCELWRILGLYYNAKEEEYNLKIISNESIGTYAYDDSEEEILTWPNSTLHKYLNEEYKFYNNYEMYIEEIEQKIATHTQTEIKEESINSKINILNLSDYLNASSCKINKLTETTEECLKNNWLNNIELNKTWTMTQKEEEIIVENLEQEETTDDNIIENNEIDDEINNETTITDETESEQEPIIEEKIKVNYAYSIGNSITESEPTELQEVRPTVYLKARMLLVDGDGTFNSPYIVK